VTENSDDYLTDYCGDCCDWQPVPNGSAEKAERAGPAMTKLFTIADTFGW